MDNKDLTNKQDSDRVNKNEPYEVEYVHQQFPGLKHEEVLEAIEKAGPLRTDIMDYLKKKTGQ